VTDGLEQAKAEVGTITECEWTADGLGECDGECTGGTGPAITATMVAQSLELKRAQAAGAKEEWQGTLLQLPDGGTRTQGMECEEAEQIMGS